jgi:hypothetical protein
VAKGSSRIVSDRRVSQVHRNLDAKLKIVGMEIHDLLFVLGTASLMNLVFGRTKFALYLVFLLPMVMAVVLYFVKRNKPDQYLIHFFRYFLSPGFFSAAEKSLKSDQMTARITDGELK